MRHLQSNASLNMEQIDVKCLLYDHHSSNSIASHTQPKKNKFKQMFKFGTIEKLKS